jgi:hypothetical protein
MPRINVRDADSYIENRRDFTTPSISGTNGSTDTGRLPVEWAELYRRLAAEGRITYTVRSYATPIGWDMIDANGETVSVVPDVRYSSTTSQQQGMTKRGFGRVFLETFEGVRDEAYSEGYLPR